MNSFYEAKLDSVGRLTIPVRVRKVLDIERNGTVILNFDNEKLEVRKKDYCSLSNSVNNILNAADDSEDLTISEYRQLQEILAKLQK